MWGGVSPQPRDLKFMQNPCPPKSRSVSQQNLDLSFVRYLALERGVTD